MDATQLALWLVLIGFVVVFISDTIGNFISFENRIVNALVTGVVFTVIFGLIVWQLTSLPEVQEASQGGNRALLVVLFGFAVVVVSDFIGNNIAFGSQFLNSFVTSTVFALIFGSIIYFGVLQQ